MSKETKKKNRHAVTTEPCTTKMLPRFTGDKGISAPAPLQMGLLQIFSENLVGTWNLDRVIQYMKRTGKEVAIHQGTGHPLHIE
jgi:hypothetical protein